MEKICLICGKKFIPRNGTKGVYCSNECKYNRGSKKVSLIKCEYCGKKFIKKNCWLKRTKHHFCSKECYDKGQTKLPIMYCKTCGKEIKNKNGRIRKFCSLKCAYGNRSIETNKTGSIKICINCGKEFYLEKRRVKSGGGKYCSLKCRKEYEWLPNRKYLNCLVCGKRFYKIKSEPKTRRFCSFNCYRKYIGESSLEKTFRKELEKRKIVFKQEVKFNKFSVDFIVKNIAIEIDGNYWHTKESVMKRDKRKENLLKIFGYKVLRFTEEEIKQSISECVDKLENLT